MNETSVRKADDIRYTHHAQDKFAILARHGFEVTSRQVEKTVFDPDKRIPQPDGTYLAQRGISKRHVLRVVYRQEERTVLIITFYPGRRDRYEG